MRFQIFFINLQRTEGRTHAQKDGQAQSNMPLQLFKRRGHNVIDHQM